MASHLNDSARYNKMVASRIRRKGELMAESRKGRGARSKEIPRGYVEADPNGNRQARRLAEKEAKAAKQGRNVGTSTGGAPQEFRRVRRKEKHGEQSS